MLGTTDLAREGVTAQEIVAAIIQLHMVCHSYGVQTVALPIPPNRASSTPRDDLVMFENTRQQVNRLLKEWTVIVVAGVSFSCHLRWNVHEEINLTSRNNSNVTQ